MSLLLANWKMIAIAVLVAACYFFFALWQHSKEELAAFRASVAATAQAQINENNRIANEQIINLNIVRNDYENRLPDIRTAAVAAYLRRMSKPASGSSGVSSSGPGLKLDDVASQESIPDTAFIADCAEDAAKVGAWVMYGKLNHLPVKD